MAVNDVKYFRDLVAKEKGLLTENCEKWKDILTGETLPEEASGEIRTAIGLTELLLGQKLKQFEGLVDDCEHNTGEKEITCEDLQGFYDMVYVEVEKIHKKFDELKKLQNNNWEPKGASPVKKPKPNKAKVPQPTKEPKKPNQSTKAHILAARQRLMEAKANALKKKDAESKSEEQKENVLFMEIQPLKYEPKKSGKVLEEKKGDSNVPVRSKAAVSSKRKPKESTPLSCITRSAARKAQIKVE